MALPQLSAEDRTRNLAKAAEMRSKRSVLRTEIKEGKITLVEILEKAADPVVGRMKVSTLIESLPGFGKAKTSALMDSLGISPSRRVQGLGQRQHEELLKVLS
ncbi:MAG: integration host factor [Coriobacteriia bacterium]|nr:integration host factor [Coriobacteriia bacterium]